MKYLPILMRTEDREFGTYGVGWVSMVMNAGKPGHRYKFVPVRLVLTRDEADALLARGKERGWNVE